MEMEDLIKPGVPVDINLYCYVANCAHNPTEILSSENANAILYHFTEREDSFLYSDQIINSNCPDIGKFAAIQSISKVIQINWFGLTEEIRNQIKTLLMFVTFNSSFSDYLAQKSSSTLIQILYYEFPQIWFSCINDFLKEATDNIKCKRCLNLLSEFFSKLYKDSTDSDMSSKAFEMGKAITDNFFLQLSNFVMFVIQNINDLEISKIALRAISFLPRWTRFELFFESTLINFIVSLVESGSEISLYAIPVLTESLHNIFIPFQYNDRTFPIFGIVVNSVINIIKSAPELIKDDKYFMTSFFDAMNSFFNDYTNILVKEENAPILHQTINLMIDITDMLNEEFFESFCSEFWITIIDSGNFYLDEIYARILRNYLLKMPIPYEPMDVVVNGEKVTRISETEDFCISSTCVLSMLINRKVEVAYQIVEEIFSELQSNLNYDAAIHLCYSLACFANVDNNSGKNQFLVEVFKILFQICNDVPDPNIHSQLIMGIYYLCSECYSFLSLYPQLLRVVVEKMVSSLMSDSQMVKDATLISMRKLLHGAQQALFAFDANTSNSIYDSLFECLPAVLQNLNEDNAIDLYFAVSFSMSGSIMQQERMVQLVSFVAQQFEGVIMKLGNHNYFDFSQLFVLLRAQISLTNSCTQTYTQYFQTQIGNFANLFQMLSASLRSFPPNEKNNQFYEVIRNAKNCIIDIFSQMEYYNKENPQLLNSILEVAYGCFLDDFLQLPPDERTPETVNFFTSHLEFIGKEGIHLPLLKDKLILPTIEMLNGRICFPGFPFAVGNLITNLISLYVMELDDDAINFLIETTKGYIVQKFENCDHLITKLSQLFNEVGTTIGRDAELRLFETQGLKMVDFLFRLAFDVQYKSSIFTISMALQTILTSTYIKSRWEDVIAIIYGIIPNCQPDEIQKILKCTIEKELFSMTLRDFLINARFLARNDPDLQMKKQRMKERVRSIVSKDPDLHIPNYQESEEGIELSKKIGFLSIR